MRYMTDQQAQEFGLPTDSAEAGQVLADADALYGYIQGHLGATDSDLAVAAEQVWGAQGPDRLAPALKFLLSVNRLLALDDAAAAPAAAQAEAPTAKPAARKAAARKQTRRRKT
jgi:hypothetical protein